MLTPMRASFCLVVFAIAADAQSTFGNLVGTTHDSSGAALPSTRVQARNLDENTIRAATSNDQGLYEILNLNPGRYEITAQKTGFGVTKVPETQLAARQTLRVELTLDVAAVTETVTVAAAGAAINTENGTIADSKTFEQITQLPVNYRGKETTPLSAILTVPGVQEDASGNISVGGGLPAMVDFTVDGISTASVRSNGPLRDMYPSSEMLGEFRVTAVNNNAEFAQMGDVTVATKSGGNRVHGSAFWYHQNRALDATVYGSNGKPAKVWNTFGGSISGPVVLPKLYNGHDKTFFFLDYEGNRKPGQISEQYSVPTAAMRTGNLNGLPGGAAIDPSTGLPFPNNQIPASQLNPVAQKLLSKYYPQPNFGTGTNANYRILKSVPSHTDGFDTRVDHYFSASQQLFGRYSWKQIPSVGSNGLLPSSDVTLGSKNLIVSHNLTIRSNLINEARYGLSFWEQVNTFPINGASSLADLGIQGLDVSNHPHTGAFPNFSFGDGTGFSGIGRSKDGPTRSRTQEFSDNLSWIVGRHNLKFGGDFRKLSYNDLLIFGGSDDFGNFDFNKGAFSGNAFADLLLGLPYDSYYSVTSADLNQGAPHYNLFAQDEWHVNDRLTVSFGLRWEFHPGFTEKNGNMTNFDHATGDVVIPNHTQAPAPGFLYAINACPGVSAATRCTKVLTASQAGLPDSLRKPYYRNFDPRVSFAWRPFGGNRTVVRAGFGVFTETTLGPLAYGMTGIHTSDTRFFNNYQGPGKPPVFTLPQASGGSFSPDALGSEDFIDGTSYTYRDPRSYQWSFTIEREISTNASVRASYVGSNSVGLHQNVDFNQVPAGTTKYSPSERPFLNWNRLISRENVGFANYQGLQLETNYRMRRGLILQGSYTLAKDLGNSAIGSNGLPGETGNGVTDRFNTRLDRGDLAAVRRHRGLITGLYQLPFGKGRAYLGNMHPALQALFGGWEVSTIGMFQTGPYLTPTMSKNLDQSNTNLAGRFNVTGRPDRIGNGNLANPTPQAYFDISAFRPPPVGSGRFGNAGVGILEGPGTIALATGLAKQFALKEWLRMRFEATFINILNHPNFAAPSTNISSPSSFGVITSVQSAENSGNRVGQLGLRFDF